MSCMPDFTTDDLCARKEKEAPSEDIESRGVEEDSKESFIPPSVDASVSIDDTPLVDCDPSFESKATEVNERSANDEATKTEAASVEEDKATVDDEEGSEDHDDLAKEPLEVPAYKKRKNMMIASGIFVVLILIIVLATTLGGKGDDNPNITSSAGKGDKVTGDNVAAVDAVIRKIAIFGGEEFEDPESYQSKALKWVKQDTFGRRRLASTGKWSEKQLVQRYALASFYYSTYQVGHMYTPEIIGGWIEESDWMTSADECGWHGVTCQNKNVDELVLNENGLTGSLPKELTLLSSLTHLDVSGNILYNYGSEGNDWLGDMTSLKYLSYAKNYFDYTGIPTQISKLTNLVEYDCSYTLYFGPLEGEVFKGLDRLQLLDISGNSYNSTIPDTLAELSSLERLYVMDTHLSGSFDFVSKMPMIEELWLDYNVIKGTIPTAINQISSLYSLSVYENKLSNQIPTEIGQLFNLKQVWLNDNSLTGSIPTEFQALTGLEVMYVSGNKLTGAVPNGVCGLKSLSLEKLVVNCGEDDNDITCTCCDTCDY